MPVNEARNRSQYVDGWRLVVPEAGVRSDPCKPPTADDEERRGVHVEGVPVEAEDEVADARYARSKAASRTNHRDGIRPPVLREQRGKVGVSLWASGTVNEADASVVKLTPQSSSNDWRRRMSREDRPT
jgi:hypothetical protein